MRIALEHLDTRGLALDWPSAAIAPESSRVVFQSARGLRGQLESHEALLRISELRCEQALLEALTLCFGRVVLRQVGEAALQGVRSSYAQEGGQTELDLQSERLDATRLSLQIAPLLLEGETHMQGVRLTVQGDRGGLAAAEARLASVRFEHAGLTAEASELWAEALEVGWGPEGFRLRARSLTAPELRLTQRGVRVEAGDLRIDDLSVYGPNIQFAKARLARAGIRVELPPEPAERVTAEAREAAREQVEAAPAPRFDYRVLDGLSGLFHVDVAVDMTVPILGSRRAKHKLRITLEDGTLDYRALEADLAALEESLLDFAVREGALVLERGIPLLPTRGRGKPLLIWRLSEPDLALAEKRRVRLSVLPQVELAPELQRSEGNTSKNGGSFALRRLGLENIALQLSLSAPPEPLAGLLPHVSLGQLRAKGEVVHDPSGALHPGVLQGELEELETAVQDLALGSLRAHVDALRLTRLSGLTLQFEGLRVRRIEGALEELVLREARLKAAQT